MPTRPATTATGSTATPVPMPASQPGAAMASYAKSGRTEKSAMMAMWSRETAVQQSAVSSAAATFESMLENPVMMAMKPMMMPAPTPVRRRAVATVFYAVMLAPKKNVMTATIRPAMAVTPIA